jgi:glucan phosphoethanolaminetransferase (alkaline phosphatase superfamily)
VTGPLASVGFGTGFAAKTLTFGLISETRVYVLLAIAAATLVLAVRGLTRWVVWSAGAILVTFVSMASFSSEEKSGVEMPGWVSDVLSSIAKGAMNLVTFQYGTPCLVLGILLILGVGAWRCRSAD